MTSINLTIPLYNEELVLSENVIKILDFLTSSGLDNAFEWQIILADNASTDKTAVIAQSLAGQFPKKIQYLYLSQKGRGQALKKAWQNFPADFYIYLDADLATDLNHLPEMINFLHQGNDIVIGSRLHENSSTTRGLKREMASRFFNFLLKTLLNFSLKDSQCGFKGINQKVLQEIIPLARDNNWFFDTELLFWAQKKGLKIKELPVLWIDAERKSKVTIIPTALNYLKNIWRLKKYGKIR